MPQRIFTQTFGVVAALIEKDGKILLVKESLVKDEDNGKWNHPAGWIEVGEEPMEAVRREVKEETGYDFTPNAILGVYSLVRKDLERLEGQARHPIKIVFLGSIADGPPGELYDDVSETRWFAPEEIYAMDQTTLRDSDIKQMVKDYFAGRRYPLDLLRHEVSE